MQDIIQEYRALTTKKAAISAQLRTLPKGYISKKNINGKEYYYQQYRIGSRIFSHFIKMEDVDTLSEKIALRKQLEKEKKTVSVRIRELEKASSIIDYSMYQRILRIKLVEAMDTLPMDQKERSLSFSEAMTAVEGVPVSEKVRQQQIAWKNGEITFDSLLVETLTHYGFPVEVE